jgi:hypothetical protein
MDQTDVVLNGELLWAFFNATYAGEIFLTVNYPRCFTN